MKGPWLLLFPALALAALALRAAPAAPTDQASLIIVIGAAGEKEFGDEFIKWAGLWEKAGRAAGAKTTVIGTNTLAGQPDRERVRAALLAEPPQGAGELWLVLIGHGTFNGREAKFNLVGPDFAAADLAEWLKPLARPLAVINCSSASAPFINALSRDGRVIITATKSGHEDNFARFGRHLAASITDPRADLDKDGQTSLLEAFLSASRQTEEFYKTEGRLSTEHALLDDNGDGLGTPADWFRGIHAVKKAGKGASLDGLRAHQFHLVRNAAEQRMPPALRARRDELERAAAKLRELKPSLPEDEYYARLESLMIELAKIYKESERAAKED
jgi:hypothetical protein